MTELWLYIHVSMILDTKLTFESHVRSITSSITQKIGLLRKCRRIYANDDVVRNCFYSFILPLFEYCSPVWISAADTHMKLLDRAFAQIKFLLPSLCLNLRHRRLVGALSYLFKLSSNGDHPLYHLLPGLHQPSRVTRHSLMLNDRAFSPVFCRSSQFSRCFISSTSKLWNSLPNDIVDSSEVGAFKLRVNSFLLS